MNKNTETKEHWSLTDWELAIEESMDAKNFNCRKCDKAITKDEWIVNNGKCEYCNQED